jgi:hypothetical protein
LSQPNRPDCGDARLSSNRRAARIVKFFFQVRQYLLKDLGCT